MFPGYLFVHHAMDKHGYVQVLQARGVVRILGERWDRLAPVDDAEIAAIQQLATTDVHVLPHPYLREGHRVRIVDGPLTGLEGVLLQVKPGKGLLVVSVELLQRSVAVEVDCTRVVSIGNPTPPPHPPIRRHHRVIGAAGMTIACRSVVACSLAVTFVGVHGTAVSRLRAQELGGEPASCEPVVQHHPGVRQQSLF